MKKLHICKYCGVETTHPDEKCYAKPTDEKCYAKPKQKLTPVEYLYEQVKFTDKDTYNALYEQYYEAKEAEREQNMNLLINFQQYLCEGEYITDYEWDFENMAIKFLNSKKKDL